MTDVVVTCPQSLWLQWLDEGDLPGDPPSEYESHWMIGGRLPKIEPGERVYIVSFGRLRGYAPLVDTEESCALNPERRCLVREGGAVAVTIRGFIRGFQGWRYRWWERADEMPFPNWKTERVPANVRALIGI
jgi:hypothetical protein